MKKNGTKSPLKEESESLSRRERQIMDIVYAGESVTAREVWEKIPDAPTYATVRTLLRVLLEKGQLKHKQQGRSYLYEAARSREKVAESALKRLLQTFYKGSVEQAVSGLLELRDTELDEEELERIEKMISEHKAANRKKS